MGFWRIHPATFSTSILLTARLVQSVFHLPLTRITLWTFHPFILHHRDFRYSRHREASATLECATSDGLGPVELWDGDLPILWADQGVEQFGAAGGSQGKQYAPTLAGMVL